jgi:hypothetical protein
MDERRESIETSKPTETFSTKTIECCSNPNTKSWKAMNLLGRYGFPFTFGTAVGVLVDEFVSIGDIHDQELKFGLAVWLSTLATSAFALGAYWLVDYVIFNRWLKCPVNLDENKEQITKEVDSIIEISIQPPTEATLPNPADKQRDDVAQLKAPREFQKNLASLVQEGTPLITNKQSSASAEKNKAKSVISYIAGFGSGVVIDTIFDYAEADRKMGGVIWYSTPINSFATLLTKHLVSKCLNSKSRCSSASKETENKPQQSSTNKNAL